MIKRGAFVISSKPLSVCIYDTRYRVRIESAEEHIELVFWPCEPLINVHSADLQLLQTRVSEKAVNSMI